MGDKKHKTEEPMLTEDEKARRDEPSTTGHDPNPDPMLTGEAKQHRDEDEPTSRERESGSHEGAREHVPAGVKDDRGLMDEPHREGGGLGNEG